jgi:hypothetical protein
MTTCKRCGAALVRKENQFYWRQYWFPGLVCETCHALCEDPDKPFVKCVAELSKTRN